MKLEKTHEKNSSLLHYFFYPQQLFDKAVTEHNSNKRFDFLGKLYMVYSILNIIKMRFFACVLSNHTKHGFLCFFLDFAFPRLQKGGKKK